MESTLKSKKMLLKIKIPVFLVVYNCNFVISVLGSFCFKNSIRYRLVILKLFNPTVKKTKLIRGKNRIKPYSTFSAL